MANAITFSTLACPEWSAETVIARAAEYGYDGLEWRGGAAGHVPPGLPVAQRAALRRRMADAGLFALAVTAYTSFVSPDPAERQANLDELRRHVDLAADLGALYVRAFLGELPPRIQPAAVYGQVADCLATAAAAAQAVGVVIAVEPHDDFARTAEITPILRRVPHPALGVIWDIANAYAAGEDPATGHPNVQGRLAYVQVKDGRGRGAAWQLTPLGAGDVPLDVAFALLAAGGYRGAFSVEWERAWHPELDPPEVVLPTARQAVQRWLTAHGAPVV